MPKNISRQHKQVLVLYISTIVGLFLGVLSSVLNTSVLSDPAQYGDVRYVQNIISFVSSLLLVGYFVSGSRLLALSKDEEYSRRIRGIMCVILGVTVFILSITMSALFLYHYIFGKENLVWLFFSSIFVGSNVLLLNYINTTAQGDNHIVRISAARLIPVVVYLLAAWGIYSIYKATPLLMLCLYNGLAVLVYVIIIFTTRPSFRQLGQSFRELNAENRKYGFNVYLGSVANVSTTYIAGITLGYFCTDNANVGFYTLALTLSAPLSMLPSIIGTTYFKQFASQRSIEKKVLLGSVFVTIVSLLLYVLFIGLIVDLLYNDSYKSVSEYAIYLAIGTSIHGLADMFNRFLGAHGKGEYLRNGAFACGAVIAVGSIVLVYYFQIYGAIATKVLGSSVYLLMMVFYYLKFLKSGNNNV